MRKIKTLLLSRSAQMLLLRTTIVFAMFFQNPALAKVTDATWPEISTGEFERDFSGDTVLIVAMCPETSPLTRIAFNKLAENELLKQEAKNGIGTWKVTYNYGQANDSVRLLKRLSAGVKFSKEPAVSVFNCDRSVSIFAMTDIKGIIAHVRKQLEKD